MWLILLVLLFILFIAAFPIWPYARRAPYRRWGGGGYFPSGILAVLLILVLIFLVL